VTSAPSPHIRDRLASIAPALLGASSFAAADVTGKVAFRAGADALTVSMVRGWIGLALLFAWLRLGGGSLALAPRPKWIALGLGVLFAANVFLVFYAIDKVGVPIAILSYFVYPLLTGLMAAAIGLETVTWRGALAAVVAFLGLALMIGAHPTALAFSGLVAALAGACCRVVMLLVTRATLQGVDARLVTWYSLVGSNIALTLAALATWNWQPPASAGGWAALIVVSAAVTTGLLGVFASTVRIGPFRTALFMNLEPLLATIASALFLDEPVTPLQALGGATMIAALVAFQLRR
jgi:drug/metabolite transporter (DMT)-like permease